jgi:4-hydroxyphenylpyruvate dioxygenase
LTKLTIQYIVKVPFKFIGVPMLYSIATVCLSGTLREKIEAISAAGFHGIEIFETDLILHNGPVREIRDMIADNGLKIVTYQPFRDFEGMPAPIRSRTFDRVERKFDLMEDLGCDLLMICSNVSPKALGGIARAADDFAELGERAAQRGLRVAFEALGWGRFIFDYRDSWEVVRRADHPAVGLTLDTFHIFSRKTDLRAIESIPGDRIFLVQIADAPNLSMDHLSWSRHYRCFPGQGELPLHEFMNSLMQTGYDGPLSLEIFNDQFRSGSVDTTAKDGYRSLVYLGSHAEDSLHSDLPSPIPPDAVEFIEFSVDELENTELSAILSALGFVHSGRHPRKAIDRYTQGNINVVVNLEPQSFAQKFHAEHGAAVCALGLRVDDDRSVAQRCQLLNYPVSSSVTNSQHGMKSIETTGGSLLYLAASKEMEGIWSREFVPAGSAAESAFLERIDHIAYTMSYEEMLSATLLYRSVFGMKSTTPTVIADQGGLVKSYVMQTEHQAVCLALNSSQAEGTLSNRVMRKYAGTGVQHIAFSCLDIFAVASALAEAGIETMPVPQNYYDDIAARFQLSPDLLKNMQSFGILYDEDEYGSFFQLYTKHFRQRFAFEIVQRRGYRGFGAPNAPVRTAMQRLELLQSA